MITTYQGLGQSEGDYDSGDPGTFWGRAWESIGTSVRLATGAIGTTVRDVIMRPFESAAGTAAASSAGAAGVEAAPSGSTTVPRSSGAAGAAATEMGEGTGQVTAPLWPWALGLAILGGVTIFAVRALKKR